jgi:signal transduction histidine kinase
VRTRIVLLVAATTSVVILAFTLPLIALVHDVAQSAALERGTTIAQSLVPVVSNGDAEAIRLALTSLASPEGTTISVYLPATEVLGSPRPLDDAVRETANGAGARTVAQADGTQSILIPVFVTSGARVIAVDVSADALDEGVARATVVIVGLGLVLFLLSLLVADRLARTMTRPLTELAEVAETLGSGDLQARVVPSGPPEVREVGSAMNQLATRIGELLVEEREAIADLSHRLRTPLTSLRLDAESLSSIDERRRIESDVDALQRSVDDIIRTARRPLHQGLVTSCDATSVVADRVAFWRVLAEEQHRPVILDMAEGPLMVAIGADDLAACLDAILGNVFAHTPDGAGFAVTVHPGLDGLVRVAVADDGPGLATPGSGVIERGVSGSGSTGLGLDIVRRAAAASGGRVSISTGPMGGTRVEVVLGRPTS